MLRNGCTWADLASAMPASQTARGRTSADASRGRSRRGTSSARTGTSSGCAGTVRGPRSVSRRRQSLRPRPSVLARHSRCACRRSPGARRSPIDCSSMPASAGRITGGATSSARTTRRAISFASPNSARPDAPTMAVARTSCTVRRIGVTIAPDRTRGRPRCRT